MPTATLAIKNYKENHLKVVETFLKSKLRGLKVKTQVCETPNSWVQASISGEDENVALHYISEEIGLCPNTIADIRKFMTLKGYITLINKNEIQMDIGLSSPANVKATLSLQHLQAQLADGRKLALKKLAELYGFCENLPLTIKASNINVEENKVEASLSEMQLKTYRKWITDLLDRLIILGTSQEKVTSSLKLAKCTRDVVKIESMGLFEHAVVCKLGTNAIGLIPKIGKQLPHTTLTIFNPRKIIELLNNIQLVGRTALN